MFHVYMFVFREKWRNVEMVSSSSEMGLLGGIKFNRNKNQTAVLTGNIVLVCCFILAAQLVCYFIMQKT